MSHPYFTAVGIDPSLTACGVALIQECDGEKRREVFTLGRKGKKDETLEQRHDRIMTLVSEIVELILSLDVSALVTIEGPAHGGTTGSHHDRSGLWWMIVHEVSNRTGCTIVEVTPTQLKKYATGKGNVSKSEVMAAAIRRYIDVPIANDNEADAFVLAEMGARFIGEPIEDSLPKLNLDAMAKLARP